MEMYYTHYINIVGKTSRGPPENYVIDTNITQIIIDGILQNTRDTQVY